MHAADDHLKEICIISTRYINEQYCPKYLSNHSSLLCEKSRKFLLYISRSIPILLYLNQFQVCQPPRHHLFSFCGFVCAICTLSCCWTIFHILHTFALRVPVCTFSSPFWHWISFDKWHRSIQCAVACVSSRGTHLAFSQNICCKQNLLNRSPHVASWCVA